MTIRAAILGGTGYGGMELLRYLVSHPGVDVVALTSRSETGRVDARHPHMRGTTDLSFTLDTDASRVELAQGADVVFSAKPHGVAARELPALLDAAPDCKVIDLSGDFRLRDAAAYPTWYGFDHPSPDWLIEACYGLPECGLREVIPEARLIANPGCHASAVALALWPLVAAGLVRSRIAVTSVTGSSGSGAVAKSGTHHPERATNFKAYSPLHHQHVPEIEQTMDGEIRVDFVPQSAPMSRGIYVTAFVPVGPATADEVHGAFAKIYADEYFVRVTDKPPEVRAVAGTNFVDVNVKPSGQIAVVTLALDNLGKGMAGTAVQNMNLLFGLPERTGLDRPGAGV